MTITNGYVRATVGDTYIEYTSPYSNHSPGYPERLREHLRTTNFPPARACGSRTCLIHLAADDETHELVLDFLMKLQNQMINMYGSLSGGGLIRENDFRTALANQSAQLERVRDVYMTLLLLLSMARVFAQVCDMMLAGCCMSDDLPFLAVLRMYAAHVVINTKIRSTSDATAVHVYRSAVSDFVRVYDTDAPTSEHAFPGPMMIAFIFTIGSVVEYDIHKPPWPATEKDIIPPTPAQLRAFSERERDAAAPPHTVEHSIRRVEAVMST
jgi:hypothetical protein